MKCGPGIDTVIESEWPGNRKLVKISSDCEKRTRHVTKTPKGVRALYQVLRRRRDAAIAIRPLLGIDRLSVFVTQ